MKLLVIVLCLMSERYLVHSLSLRRFDWLSAYGQWMESRLAGVEIARQLWVKLAIFLLPLVLMTWLVCYLLGSWFFGLFGFALNLLIFYYCLGPQNPFYPVYEESLTQDEVMSLYFAQVNSQLFALIFWYIAGGPAVAVLYRVTSLLVNQQPVAVPAKILRDWLEWIPARITALLYLLVGNFQKGVKTFVLNVFADPEKNNLLLSESGMAALAGEDSDDQGLALAEQRAEYALVLALVLLALFTLASWL